MPNVNIATGTQTQGEFAIEFQRNGYGGVIPIINNKPEPSLMFGYVSESDREACVKLITDAVKATNGNIAEVRQYIMNATQIAAADIVPEETVMVGGYELLINYTKKEIYFGTEKIADMEDVESFTQDHAIIKALLVERANTALLERYYPDPYDDDDLPFC